MIVRLLGRFKTSLAHNRGLTATVAGKQHFARILEISLDHSKPAPTITIDRQLESIEAF